MINVVLGNFITTFTSGQLSPENMSTFLSDASVLALQFVYIGIAKFACTYIYSTSMTYTSLRITKHIRHRFLEAALSQEVGFFDQGKGVVSISTQATVNGKHIQAGTAEKLGQVFQAIATFVAAFVIAFIKQWKLTLILTCLIPSLLIVVSVAGVIDSGIEIKLIQQYGEASAFAESAIAGIRTVKAYTIGRRMALGYSKFLTNARTLGDRKNLLYAIMFGGEYFLIYAGMGLAFWQGITMISRGEVEDVGTIFTVLFSVIIATSQINSIAPHTVAFGRAATAAGELFRLIDRRSSIDPLQTSGKIPNDLSGSIELENVSFSYPSRPDSRVLHDYSLKIPANKVTAFVGPSGSGKSTIIALLERWYDPNHGSIRLGNIDTRDLNLKWLRTNVRLVQQEPVLFNTTVYDNICQGLIGTQWENEPRDRKMQLIQDAAKLAFAHEFITALPQGYDTPVGERGGLLSGGQKQRIAIARSVVSQPRILLLDEATSALDPHAEGVVQKALDAASSGRTTIVIAHKLKTIQKADNIVVMKKGSICEQGRHEELVAQQGVYAALVTAQNLSQDKEKTGLDANSGQELSRTQTTQDIKALPQALQKAGIGQDRENYALHRPSGLLRSILNLVKATPEIKSWYMLVVATCIVGSGMYPGQTFLLAKVMSAFGQDDMQQQGNFYSLMMFVMAIGIAILYGILGWATNVISQTLNTRIRQDMLNAILQQDVSFFDRPENTVGELSSRIESYATSIFELMGFTIAIVLLGVAALVSCSILSIAFSWKLGLVAGFAGIPPMVLGGFARLRIETSMDSKIDKKFSKSSSIAYEAVNATRTVSSLAMEQEVFRKYVAELDAAVTASRTPIMMTMIFSAFTQAVEYFVLALGFWWASKLMSEGELTFYTFFVSFMSVFYAGQGAALMSSFASSFTKANAAANYFFWLKELQPTIAETEENKSRSLKDECSSYNFQEVGFAYPLAPEHQVLRNVSLKIRPGQFVAFVGASGCGKSTMISLLERYYDPTEGTITIDNEFALTDISPNIYRNHVSLVQQEPTLFPGSIRDNIAMGIDKQDDRERTPLEDDAQVEAACRAANAWEFISSFPDGLNTLCGVSGSQLSGGQKQRIAIARALVSDPSVLLLDEATSALDTESERIVQAAIMDSAVAKNKITIAVAHRLSTIRDANCIFVFMGGRVVEAGTHGQLMARGQVYKQMCEAQNLDSAV